MTIRSLSGTARCVSGAARRSIALGALALLAACGADAGGGGTFAADGLSAGDGAIDASLPEPDPNKPLVDLVVDANRNGALEPQSPAEQQAEVDWNNAGGASYLANLDDDDGDKLEDAFDDVVNGEADALDLARVRLRAWPKAPDGTTATLQIEGAQWIKLFRASTTEGVTSWSLVGGVSGKCDWHQPCSNARTQLRLTTDDIRQGVEFGVEGVQFRMSEAWDGRVRMTLTLADSTGTPLMGQDGQANDAVTLGIAPWLLNGNLSAFDKVRSALWTSKDEKRFNTDMTPAVAATGVEYLTYAFATWTDQWTQDFFQTGIHQIPTGDGKVQGMRVFNARPWGRSGGQASLPISFLRKNILGPDVAIVAVYKKTGGTTYDSHGNHDLLPAYTRKDGAAWPLGRIITGSGVLPETWDFYDAQRVQGPHVEVKTSWLYVGHVDEALSYLPAKTPLGWKLAVKDGAGAKALFEKAAADGHGSVKFWTGLTNYDPQSDKEKSAEETVDSVLANEDILAWTEESHVEVDGMVDVVLQETGMDEEADLFYIKFLTEHIGGAQSGGKVAWQPGMVNSLVLNDHWLAPHPFGPIIDGKDIFVDDMATRMGDPANLLGANGTGMTVHAIDDWYGYHIQLGEVHCASNPEAPPSASLAWWLAPQLLLP